MMFWIITAAMTALVGLLLARAVWRSAATAPVSTADVQVYRDQLAEVARDLSRGVVPEEEATRLRTEISRRILAADTAAQQTQTAQDGPRGPALVGFVLGLIALPFGLYLWLGAPGYGDLALADRIAFAEELRKTRPGQQAAEASIPRGVLELEMSQEDSRLLDLLRAKVAERPEDLEGHRLLARYEAKAGRFAQAVAAQDQVLRLLGADALPQDMVDYGEFMVLAAGGYVSPEAEMAFRGVLNADPENGSARYYLGLMLVQTGRPDQALRIWDALLRRGPAEAPWIAPIQRQIMAIAPIAGVDYTPPQVGPGAAPGPSEEDIAAASEMSASERMEMIGGMVTGLSDRLAREGGPARDWARLITSLAVLGDAPRARAVYDNAVEVFADDPGAMDMIRAAGSQAGVAE